MDGTRTPTLDELIGQERWLRALARRLVRDAATADDLVQETWLRALRAHGEDGRGVVSDARAWLGRVLRNVWRERGRSERTRGRREARVAVSEALPSARESVERVELARRLAALVLALDEPYRSIVVWRYYEGRSAAAIAAELGEPAARVRWRLMHARELLRRRLERERGDWAARYALFLPVARRPPAAVSTGAASAGGVAVFSVGSKLLAAVVVAALLVWTVARLRNAPSAPDPGAPGGGTVVVAPAPSRGQELAAPARSEQRASNAPETSPAARAETAAITVDPSARLRGTVRAAEGGGALAGAEVALFAAGKGSIRARTAADGSGEFLLEAPEPGTYDIAARAPDRLPLRVSALELAAGSETELVLELARGFVVSVEVVERASSAPVAVAEVQLVPGDKDTVVWFTDDDLSFRSLAGVTAPDGRAELGGAERGIYQYVVSAPGHAPALGEVLLEPDAAPLSIALDRGGAVHGTVSRADGSPAEGARVFLNPLQYEKFSDRIFRENGLAADRQGRYRLEGVPAGIYHAVALLPDGSGVFHFDPERPSERALGLVQVEDAAEVLLDFRLPDSGNVRGRVLAPDGSPIPGARLIVSWGDFKSAANFFPISEVAGVKESIHHSTTSDGDGRFELANLRISHEPLELRVRADGYDDTVIELDVPSGARLEPVITMQPLGATIRGRLTDAQGAPVAGQVVGAFESDGERLGSFFQATSGADGSYELMVAAAGARHRVKPVLRDRSPHTSEPELREGVAAGTIGVDFVLHAKRRLHGTVVDDAGHAVRDFVVHVLEHGAEGKWSACSEGNRGEGRFEVFVEPARVAQLRFSAPGCDPAALLDLAREAEQSVVLRRAGDLEGVVLDAAGRGVEGAVVALATLDSAIYPRGTGFAPRATTDADGRFRLPGVPDPSAVPGGPAARAGHVLVCPRRDDAPPLLHYPLPVPRGASLELVLPRSVPVELAFTDAGGRAIEGGVIVLDGAGWPLEPALETHLVDQASDTRGVLVAGRTRFHLSPGPHLVILVRGTDGGQSLPVDLGKPMPFEVADPGPGEAELQARSFTVGDGR